MYRQLFRVYYAFGKTEVGIDVSTYAAMGSEINKMKHLF